MLSQQGVVMIIATVRSLSTKIRRLQQYTFPRPLSRSACTWQPEIICETFHLQAETQRIAIGGLAVTYEPVLRPEISFQAVGFAFHAGTRNRGPLNNVFC